MELDGVVGYLHLGSQTRHAGDLARTMGGDGCYLAAIAWAHAILAVAEAIEAAFGSRRVPEIPAPDRSAGSASAPLPGAGPPPGL